MPPGKHQCEWSFVQRRNNLCLRSSIHKYIVHCDQHVINLNLSISLTIASDTRYSPVRACFAQIVARAIISTLFCTRTWENQAQNSCIMLLDVQHYNLSAPSRVGRVWQTFCVHLHMFRTSTANERAQLVVSFLWRRYRRHGRLRHRQLLLSVPI